ncbi:hypothetical protein ASE37_18865 [Rhizobium sp. Root268]|nr:hypothetical protein ASC86_18365 [Rhizobium sp. Root1212]KRD21585.1 hypothetical protein ASE37_18865 [Rhizobium sp. Root268]
MRVTALQPVANSGGGSVKVVATFDLQLNDDVRLFGLRLMEAPGGKRLIYAANANGGRRTATFSPSLATAITASALTELERHATADGIHKKTA